MPELPISDGNGNLLAQASVILVAVLTHPVNEKQRREFIAVRYMDDALDGKKPEDRIEFSADLLRVVLNAPPKAKVDQRATDTGAGGSMAGDILEFLVRFHEHCPEHASLLKAVAMLERTLLEGTDRQGQKMPHSRAVIFENWRRFKSAAHLWAALGSSLALSPDDRTLMPEFDPERLESIPNFIALAERFRSYGESIKALRGGPILDAATTWKAPKDLKLPEVGWGCPPLTNEERQVLERYRSPKRL